MKKYFLLSGIVGLLSLGSLCLNSCTDNRKVEETNVYAIQTLTPQTCRLTTFYSATMSGRQDVEIYPQVSGKITQVCVEEGNKVNKGQLLFVIDREPYLAVLNMAKANVRAARAQVADARLTYEARKELLDELVISEFDLLTAVNALESAEAQLAQRQAEEERAANDLSYTEVRSPADGVVGTLPYRVGALVSSTLARPLTTISDNAEMWVYFSMNETHLLSFTRIYGTMAKAIAAMPAVGLQLSDGSVYPHDGRIRSISGVIDRSTGSVTLKAVFSNEGRLLHSGATGNVMLPTVYTDCIVIPQTATYELQDKRFAYKVVDGKAQVVEIQVSTLDNGQTFIVESGLSAGDTIITEGIGTLREGTPISIQKEEDTL